MLVYINKKTTENTVKQLMDGHPSINRAVPKLLLMNLKKEKQCLNIKQEKDQLTDLTKLS